jgi:hypothetical protein
MSSKKKDKLSKSESRKLRKAEKAEREKPKNIKFGEGVHIRESPIRNSFVPQIRGPFALVSDQAYKQHAFQWGTEHSDRDGEWSWLEPRDWSEEEHIKVISAHLDSLIGNSWSQVEVMTYNGADRMRRRLNKYQELVSLRVEAQERWISIDVLSQFDTLFRLRVDSDKRLWGVRVQHHFFLVWYDRGHQIYQVHDD